jgi:hypothetical protein
MVVPSKTAVPRPKMKSTSPWMKLLVKYDRDTIGASGESTSRVSWLPRSRMLSKRSRSPVVLRATACSAL